MSKKGSLISSLSIAIFAILPLLNLMVMRVVGMGEGFLSLLYVLSFSFILLSAFIFNTKYVKPLPSFWIILVTILIMFILTQVVSPLESTLKPAFFFVCTIVAFIVPQLVEIDSKQLLRLMSLIPAGGIFMASSFFADDGSIKMNVTYAFLMPIVSSVVYCFTYFKDDKGKIKLVMLFSIVVNFVYFLMCLLFGSRAPSMSVVLCILFLFCTIYNKKMRGFKFKKNTWLYLVLPIIIVLNYRFFLVSTERFFSYFGWETITLERLIALDDMGSLDSGRADINKLAIKGIEDSPLWGHGMSTSEVFTGQSYPHNFILQLLLDGGLILFFIFIIPFVRRLVQVKRQCTFSEFSLLTALFFAAVPAALFSLDLWENASFWLFMGFLFSKRFHFSSNKNTV